MALKKGTSKKSETSTAVLAPTQVEKEPVTSAVAVRTETQLPSLNGASPELIARMEEVRGNLDSVEGFKLPRAKMNPDGIELIEGEEPLKEIVGVMLHTKKQNVYYAKPFKRGETVPPDCFSMDAIYPDKSIAKPVNPTCKGCPMAEFGTNQMGKGKACRNLKPVYLLLGDEAWIPRQLSITPASIQNANRYLMDLTERGIAYRKVKTRITAFKKTPGDTYMTLKFAMAEKLGTQQIRDTEVLREYWLPVMDAQVIEQREVDSASTVKVQEPSGEY